MLARINAVLNNISLSKKGIAVVSIPLIVLLISLIMTAWFDSVQRQAQARIRRSLEIKSSLNEVLSLMVDSETAVRGYLLWKRPYYLEPYNRARAERIGALAKLSDLVEGNPAQMAEYKELRGFSDMKMQALEQLLSAAPKLQPAEAEVPRKSLQSMEAIRRVIRTMRMNEDHALDRRIQEYENIVGRIRSTLIILFLLAMLVGLTASYVVSSGILKRINDLERYARHVSRGQPAKWAESGSDEIGQLGRNIEVMTRNLLSREEALRSTRGQLEKANENLASMLEETRAANQELESFSYSVSHDLRAPLRHVAGFSELMLRNPDSLDAKNKRYLGIIASSIQQMGVLIDELLAFSRMGRTSLKADPVELNTVLHDVINDFSPELQEREIEWKIGDLPVVKGDKVMIQLVFQNLIGNALKYTRERSPAIIEISSEPHSSLPMYVIKVKDNGVGFNMEYVDKLFGVFQRLHSTEEYEGTGIGLATVRRIVNRHGGHVEGRGEIGKGAEFTFTLPVYNEDSSH